MTKLRWVRSTTAALAFTMLLPGLGQAQMDDRLERFDRALAGIYDGSTVSLQQCVDLALLGSSRVGSAEEDLGSAHTDNTAALMAFLPNLSFSGSWQRDERTDLDQTILDSNGIPTGETEDVTITQTIQGQRLRSGLTIFSGFSRFANKNAAAATLAASEATLDYQRHLVRESVVNAYFDLLRAQQRVEVAMDSEELARRELERSETYFDLGISTKADVLQAKVRHQQTKLDVVRERNGERNAFAALAHAMNIPRAERFQVDSTLPNVDAVVVPEVDALVDQAQSRRLDLQASAFTLDARESGITAARAGYYPSFEVFGSWSRSLSETPYRFGSQENYSFSWGLQYNWNLFDRWSTQQQTRRAVAEKRRAEYNYRQAELDLELEVVQLHNNLVEAVESYDVSTVSVEQSQEDLRLAEERFRVGAGTSLDVITAQVNLATARRDLVDAEINILKFRNQLERAVGGQLPE